MDTIARGCAFLFLLVLMVSSSSSEVQQMSQDGYRLAGSAQYLIVAPKLIRPGRVYMLQASLFSLYYKEVYIRAVLSRNGEEYASQSVLYTKPGTKPIQLDVPNYLQNGTHRLLVEGLLGEGAGRPLFVNETNLNFDSRYVSIFIQTDRSIYFPEQPVLFRIVGLTPDLKPFYGTMTVYVLDAGRNIVQRWLSQQLNMGMFSGRFDLTYPVKTGQWYIQVDAFGHIYEQEFNVDFYYPRRFEVNVTTPMSIMDTEWGLVGHLYGEHLSGRPATGNATISVRARDEEGNFLPGELIKHLNYMTATVTFDFSMGQLSNEFGNLAGKELFFKGWIHDWMWLETQNGTSVTKVLADGVKVEILGRKLRTFKPAVPFTIYMAVKRTDNTPYDGVYDRQVVVAEVHEGDGLTRTSPEKRIIIPDDNIVRLTVRPNQGDRKIYIRAWHISSPKDKSELEMFRYYSPQSQYISIQTATEAPKVNEYAIFTLHTSIHVPEVNYLVMGAGGILLGETLRMSSHQKTFSIAVSREMAPVSRILAYYMTAGEVVVDALNFFVKDTRLTSATMTLNSGKDFSGDTIEIVGNADPGSYLMLVGHDYELYKRGGDTFLTEDKVREDLRKYDVGNQAPFEHVWWYNDDRWDESVFFPSPTKGIDTLTTFEAAGLVALSDRNMTFRDDMGICNKTLGLGRCLSGSCFDLNRTCDGNIDCPDGFDEAMCPDPNLPEPRPHALKELHKMGRYYSDVEWLWKKSWVKPNGKAEILIDVPESTNPYVVSGFGVHPVDGLILVKDPVMHDATRTFLMLAEAPSAIRRGEMIGVRLSFFNGQDERIEIIVTLHGSDDYKFVEVDDMGYVSSYAPRTSGGDHQTMLLLEAGSSTYLHIPVVPTIESGEFTVRISSYTFVDADHEEVTISVSLDGVTNGDHTPYLIDLVNQGSIIIPDFDIPIPEIFIHPELPEHLYVPGSESATYSLFGDVVSPGFFMDYFTTNDVIGVPHDSAEGYMTDFALNLQTLRYLQATNMLSVDETVKVLEYMKSILMRQYAYMQDDGSFKVFRRDSEPSVWVSAFIARTLNAAQASEWSEEVFIPLELLNKITMWITKQQNSTDGHFEDTSGVIYDRTMQPITVTEDGAEHVWHVAVTAYVTIALSEAARLTGGAKTARDSAKTKASEYLAGKYSRITDPFQMAITAYALHVSNHREKDNAFNKLKGMKLEGEYIYWASKPIAPNPVEVVNTVFFMQARPYFDNLGDAISATSYALLLYLAKNEYEASVPIMHWMQTQRNALMKFSSTQDTLNGLHALSEFALRETNRDIYQMQISLESTSSPSWKQTLNLNRSNIVTLYEDSIPKAYGQMKAIARGTGYALLQMDFAQNVEKPWQVSGPEFASYDIAVEQLRFSGHNSSIMDATVCTRWVRPDLSPLAGMTTVLVQIPTGFVVARDSIESLYAAGVPGLRRVRFRDGFLITLFENFTQERTCMEFRAERWYPAANVSIQQGLFAYEYAETGLQKNTMYTVYTLFHQHICQVCASFQCPYCPFYNGAGSITFPLTLLFISVLSSLFMPLICGYSGFGDCRGESRSRGRSGHTRFKGLYRGQGPNWIRNDNHVIATLKH